MGGGACIQRQLHLILSVGRLTVRGASRCPTVDLTRAGIPLPTTRPRESRRAPHCSKSLPSIALRFLDPLSHPFSHRAADIKADFWGVSARSGAIEGGGMLRNGQGRAGQLTHHRR